MLAIRLVSLRGLRFEYSDGLSGLQIAPNYAIMVRDTILSLILMLVLLGLLAGGILLITRGFIHLALESRRGSLKPEASTEPQATEALSTQPNPQDETKDVERAA